MKGNLSLPENLKSELYLRLIHKYGVKVQIAIGIEEASEYQKELCKFLRGRGNRDHLAEEIADALIGIEQMIQHFGLEEPVRLWKHKKLCRLCKDVAPDMIRFDIDSDGVFSIHFYAAEG